MSNPETTETASDLVVSASAHVVGVLAEALAQHPEGGARIVSTGPDTEVLEFDCGCGWKSRRPWANGSPYPEHVASVVAALPNIAIVELPEMEPDETLSEFHGRLEMVWAGVRFRRYSAAIDARAAGGQA